MRYAILADVHANLAAFQAVLHDIERAGGMDEIWCLGDVVGYGPDPVECIALLRRHKHVCVAGNHDWAAIGKMDTDYFNPEAAAAARWTSQQLTTDSRLYLEALPLSIEKGDFTLVHGSPREPIWEYVLSSDIAQQNLSHFRSKYCLIGHSHVPLYFECEANRCTANHFLPDTALKPGESRLIINPGSVGQPRDGDPRASYALYDSQTAEIRLHRVPYDIITTQKRMEERGLPRRLISRLAHGI